MARRAHRRGHHDPERRPRDDRQRGHHDRVCPDRQVYCQADQSSAWASSPGWVAAILEGLGDRPGPTGHDRQAAAIPQVERRPRLDAALAADPFLARRRRGCFRAAGYRDAASPERRGVPRWTRDVAVVRRHRALRRSEPQERLGPEPLARLDAEPTSAAGRSAHLVVPQVPQAQLGGVTAGASAATSTGAGAGGASAPSAAFAAAAFAADAFLAGAFLAGGGSLASFSLSRLSTGASTVEEADRTNSPMSFSMLRTVLLSTPSSFASS